MPQTRIDPQHACLASRATTPPRRARGARPCALEPSSRRMAGNGGRLGGRRPRRAAATAPTRRAARRPRAPARLGRRRRRGQPARLDRGGFDRDAPRSRGPRPRRAAAAAAARRGFGFCAAFFAAGRGCAAAARRAPSAAPASPRAGFSGFAGAGFAATTLRFEAPAPAARRAPAAAGRRPRDRKATAACRFGLAFKRCRRRARGPDLRRFRFFPFRGGGAGLGRGGKGVGRCY